MLRGIGSGRVRAALGLGALAAVWPGAAFAVAGVAPMQGAAQVAANPEPGAVALFGLGAVLVYRRLRRR